MGGTGTRMMWEPWGRGLAHGAQITKYEKSREARDVRGQRSGSWKVKSQEARDAHGQSSGSWKVTGGSKAWPAEQERVGLK